LHILPPCCTIYQGFLALFLLYLFEVAFTTSELWHVFIAMQNHVPDPTFCILTGIQYIFPCSYNLCIDIHSFASSYCLAFSSSLWNLSIAIFLSIE
jgi:hypothetical protein